MKHRLPLVLAVDDSMEILEAYSLLLAKYEFHVLLFTRAEEAYEAFCLKMDSVAFVITDGDMPGRDGVWLARQIRARSSQVPIILISGAISRYYSGDFSSLFSMTLKKPFILDEFNQAIQKIGI